MRALLQIAPSTYHQYVQMKGTEFEKPDLCIAFNSGESQVPSYDWSRTFRVLVARKILTYAAPRCRRDLAFQPRAHQNPWGSVTVTPTPGRVYGFQPVNGWLAGGFK
ncbi:hypothetical protein C8R47DRAFT_1079277 [Mycena vitilis]|nr:hypothetical protein C8R47DRAFT_1079277 [Mycena vitilis]